MSHGGPRVCRFSFQPITTPADFIVPSSLVEGVLISEISSVVIGWNENLHTLGPPWHMIGHH